MIAVLGMYPFAHLSDAYDQLWGAIRARIDNAPELLDRDAELHASWRRADLLLGQTCGWPLVTALPDVEVVGAFDVVAPFAAEGRYRSVLIGSRPLSPSELLALPGAVAAVNSDDSLSGWVSLCTAIGRRPAQVVRTGSHAASLIAVAEGRAQLASIDALSFEFLLEADRPHAADVHLVGHGPLVPSLPLITSAANAHRRDELRAAVAAAVADPLLADACARLRIRGFRPLDRSDYAGLASLLPPPAD